MLNLLRIRNLAIIEELELEAGAGLNILTGETGAGKSMLIAALKLVLGGKGRGDLVRTGQEQAEVEALFDLSVDPVAQATVGEAGVEIGASGELVVRRVITAAGRSRAYLNGALVPLQQLEQVARGLVDISSQHQHHTLVDPSSHLGHLDSFGGLGVEVQGVQTAWAAATAARKALSEAEAALRERADREDLLRMQLAEVNELKPQAGELEALEAALSRGRHSARLHQATAGAEQGLHAGNGAICERIGQLLGPLHEAARHDPSLTELVGRVEGARLELIEAARDLGHYARQVGLDPRALREAEERVYALKRLTRRHGGDLDALLAWRSAAQAELRALGEGEARVEALARAAERCDRALLERARALSAQRAGVAAELGAAITAELRGLGMPEASLHVGIEPQSAGHLIEGQRVGPRGLDAAQFLIAPNPGEAPRPLAQVASGGELSRALLALKRVLAGMGPVGLYVFDEVDTGVGGAVAEVIGRRLADVAAHHQVLCITHSPQVAAYGDAHFHVSKAIRAGRTFSQIARLSPAARQEELARMLSGVDLTASTRAAAGDLLEAARRARGQAGAEAPRRASTPPAGGGAAAEARGLGATPMAPASRPEPPTGAAAAVEPARPARRARPAGLRVVSGEGGPSGRGGRARVAG